MNWFRRFDDDEIGQVFTRRRSRLMGIEAGRLGFLHIILWINIFIQIRQPEFISLEVVVPLYLSLFFSFSVNTIYLFLFERVINNWVVTAFLFIFDAIFITALIYFTGVVQSIFIFLYLVNIIFCGLIFQRKGALLLALVTSTLFSLLLIFKPEMRGEILFFAIGLNNLGFFSVAFLSGYLSEQLNFMGVELSARRRDIKELQDLNEMIVENVTSGLMTIDTHGQVLQYNKAAETIIDRGINMVGFNINQIFPNFLEQLSEHHKFNTNGKVDRFEITYVNSREERLVLGCSVSPLMRDASEKGYVLIFQDLTQIKRLEMAMRRSEKLAAVGQLAAGIAHEIRNPLAGISGSLQLLQANMAKEGSEEHRLMAIALREIDRLNHLITEFLDYVRPNQQILDPIDVNQIIREVVEMIQMSKKAASNLSLVEKLQADQKILGHKDKLKQVFYNLVINAIQALEGRSAPVVNIETFMQDGHVMVRIRDNGCGMSEATLKRLFEPFHTTKKHGTGLGLATVHKILETHEARIFVESEKDKGTEFTIEFTRLEKLTPGERPEHGANENLRVKNSFEVGIMKKRGNG